MVQQADLVDSPLLVTEHRARKYLDRRTGRVVYAPMPVEVRAGGHIGPKLAAAVALLKSKCHVSFACIQEFLEEVFQLPVSSGTLANVVQKISAALEEPYTELREALPTQPRLGVDETGHPEAGKNLWAWCFRADEFTVFHIDPSRGSFASTRESVNGYSFFTIRARCDAAVWRPEEPPGGTARAASRSCASPHSIRIP